LLYKESEFTRTMIGMSMLRHAFAAALLCCSVLAAYAGDSAADRAVLLLAQNKPAPKPAEKVSQSKAEDKAVKPAEKPADATKTEAGGTSEAGARPAGKYDQDASNAPERRAECIWTGQRIVSLLSRDDINTAREHLNFYDRFGCPKEHITAAFRCAIRQAERQPEQTDVSARVYGCWMSPDLGENEPAPPQQPASEQLKVQ
jgi:hypothetical protein